MDVVAREDRTDTTTVGRGSRPGGLGSHTLRLPIRASLLTSCMATQMILPPLPRLLVGVTIPQRVGLGVKKEIMSENNVVQ